MAGDGGTVCLACRECHSAAPRAGFLEGPSQDGVARAHADDDHPGQVSHGGVYGLSRDEPPLRVDHPLEN